MSFNDDSSISWPMNDQFDPHFQFEQDSPPYKRPRNSEDQANSTRTHLATNNKGESNIFFKTRICAKYKLGNCKNGPSCNFAHGIEDMRQPPPNWQELVGSSSSAVAGASREEDPQSGMFLDDHTIIQKMKLCRKFYNGEECPYGERCNFLHEDPSKYREDPGRYRECSVISIGTMAGPVGNGSRPGSGYSEGNINKVVNNGGGLFDASRGGEVNMKPVYWRTKLCTKFETTGHCPFGEKCHFAHGQAELQAPGRDGEAYSNVSSVSTNHQAVAAIDASPSIVSNMLVAVSKEEGKNKLSLLKGKEPKKINRIYADWLDDVPLVQNVPGKV